MLAVHWPDKCYHSRPVDCTYALANTTHPMTPLKQTSFTSQRKRCLVLGAVTFGVGAMVLGTVAAFGLSASSDTTEYAPRAVSEPVMPQPLRVLGEGDLGNRFWREERILRGDTFPALLGRLGIDDSNLDRFLLARAHTTRLLQLLPGRTVTAVVDSEGRVFELEFRSDQRVLKISRKGMGFGATETVAEAERRLVMKSGVISTSLFAATDDAGIPDAVAIDFAELFSGDVDVHRDIRRGDRFSVLYEMMYFKGEAVRPGRIVAAEFVNQGTALQAIYFADEKTGGDYYSPAGRNLRRAFLRSPLEFSRITSGFSASRFHPVLQVWRAHKGIDYGAPMGTRVRSTADGVVTFAGWQNGYGKVVVVAHAGGHRTVYGHLQAFAPGLRQGVRVEQGEVIGMVGMTGLATGPHLHYEFHVNGIQADPLKRAPEQGPPIAPNLREDFVSTANQYISQLKLLADVETASLD